MLCLSLLFECKPKKFFFHLILILFRKKQNKGLEINECHSSAPLLVSW